VAEHRVSLIGFGLAACGDHPIGDSHGGAKQGAGPSFDFSAMGADGLRAFLGKADPAGHVTDIRISAPTFLDPSLGELLKEQGSTTSG